MKIFETFLVLVLLYFIYLIVFSSAGLPLKVNGQSYNIKIGQQETRFPLVESV
jgi:hypothetical protein